MCPQSGIRAMTYSLFIVLVCAIFTRICNFFAPNRFERKKKTLYTEIGLISFSLYLVGVAECVPLLYTLFDYR